MQTQELAFGGIGYAKPLEVNAVLGFNDIRWADSLERAFREGSMRADIHEDFEHTLNQACSSSVNVLILEKGLDGIDVPAMVGRVREFLDLPLVVVEKNGDSSTRACMIDQGVDMCFDRTDSSRVIAAGAGSLVRRYQYKHPDPLLILQNVDLKIDHSQRLVTMNDNPVGLSRSEYRLLFSLAENMGRVLSPTYLFENVWGEEELKRIRGQNKPASPEHRVSVNVSRVRSRLGENAIDWTYVQSVPDEGYMMPEYNHSAAAV